ncbi:HNH endonuclease signature motif containing protein [Cellulomonas sp. SG140]|uniref:HNH endonuclease signature motif containing protein n=1 Tax=Cellulomonas sp. SG140 TaxID=2976536 RepID=UPI0021E88AF4|nr:HNH endonuclease signature motif containing protein [Cellulomonas sp. SG140]
MTATVAFLSGDLLVDEWSDPLGLELATLVDQARDATMAAARFDDRLAATYLWGAGELAARCGEGDAGRRREWGARGMLAELAASLRVPEGTLARRLTRITMLAAFPRLHAAHLSGQLSAAHVGAVLDVFHGIEDREVLAAADAALAGRAIEVTAPQLRAAAHRWRARHAPRTREERVRVAGDRFVDVSPADEDLCWLTALLPAAAAMGVLHRIDDLAAAVTGPDESRTLPQLRADVLCDLLLTPDIADHRPGDGELPADALSGVHGAPGSDDAPCEVPTSTGVPSWVRGIVPQVVLTVPVLTLLGHGDEPAELDGFGPVDLDTARALCANAPTFTRVLTHPETGAVLSVGRQQYTVPADLRRAVQLRDATCRFPGCRRRAARCDIDHSTAWAHAGTTDLTNLACLCRKHHHLKHQAGWRVTHHPDGTLDWHSPTGRHYATRPATTLWPPPAPGAARPPGIDPPPGIDSPAGIDSPPGKGGPPGGHTTGYPDTPPF